MKATKRDMVKQLINRKSTYRISDYVRKISKALGRKVSRNEITGCLSHLRTSGKLNYTLMGQHVIGYLY